jgi:hypothetical protein
MCSPNPGETPSAVSIVNTDEKRHAKGGKDVSLICRVPSASLALRLPFDEREGTRALRWAISNGQLKRSTIAQTDPCVAVPRPSFGSEPLKDYEHCRLSQDRQIRSDHAMIELWHDRSRTPSLAYLRSAPVKALGLGVSPLRCLQRARLLKLVATSGSCGPSAFSRISKAPR